MCSNDCKARITPGYIMLSFGNNEELNQLFTVIAITQIWDNNVHKEEGVVIFILISTFNGPIFTNCNFV